MAARISSAGKPDSVAPIGSADTVQYVGRDLVTRLRDWAAMFRGGYAKQLTVDAADEIERLRARVQNLEAEVQRLNAQVREAGH